MTTDQKEVIKKLTNKIETHSKSIVKRIANKRTSTILVDIDKTIDNVLNSVESLSESSYDADLDQAIEDIKGRKYFIVPEKLAADRYTNLIKMVMFVAEILDNFET